jgi:transposase
MDLTEAQWNVVAPLLPPLKVRTDRRGRPWRDPRDVLNGILWILRTGAPWADMPDRYPAYATCFRRFKSWVKGGVLKRVLDALADDLFERGKIDLSEAYIDGTHAGAKKGDLVWDALAEVLPPKSWCVDRPSGSHRPPDRDHRDRDRDRQSERSDACWSVVVGLPLLLAA